MKQNEIKSRRIAKEIAEVLLCASIKNTVDRIRSGWFLRHLSLLGRMKTELLVLKIWHANNVWSCKKVLDFYFLLCYNNVYIKYTYGGRVYPSAVYRFRRCADGNLTPGRKIWRKYLSIAEKAC